MNGADLKSWRKANGYKSQAALQLELKLGSRTTLSSWENSEDELPRILILALMALERCPDLRLVTGERKSGASQINSRRSLKNQ